MVQSHVEQRELDLTQHLQTGVIIFCGDHLVIQRAGQWCTRLCVRRHMLQYIPFPAKIFHELRRQFNRIPFDAGNS